MTTHTTDGPHQFPGLPRYPAATPPAEPLPYHRMALATGDHRWWRPLLGTGVVLVGAVLVTMAVLVGSEIAGAVLDRPRDGDGNLLWGGIGDTALALLSLALTIPVVALAARWVQCRPLGTVSSVAGALRWRWLGLCLAVALPVAAATLGISMLLPEPGGSSPEPTWAGLSPFLLGLAAVCLLVPFQAAAEEYVFRGWLSQAVGAWCRSPWIVVTPQALLFAAAHGWGTPWGFADLVVFGLITGLLTIRTGGLEAAIALHVLNNLLPMGMLSAIAGGLETDETAADMNWMMLAVDVLLVSLYAAAVLWLSHRRGLRASTAPQRSA
ncbi:CPBP family intramembrane metalloprotease [Streptomyces europaeiscabiei]|uniref:CPBP family intramembrane glutamic endopeptidase n=1 Tax=Streptomyces europaeiscabiei TaxID=146819 RepID=UPI0029A0BE9D|nr:CPBP family intramembrane glutamic endopeptidase [Streptomyces europaeiscabiei]MDX3690165.1 CPBP family intramembrane metalloprotease [Streptomyces europaeiscabiei]